MAESAERRDWLAVGFAALFPTFAAWLYFDLLAGHPAMKTVAGVCKAVQFGFPLAWVVLVAREPVHMPRPVRAGVGAGLLFGIAVAAAALGLYFAVLKSHPAFADAPRLVRAKLQDLNCNSPARFLFLGGFISILHSGLEEYYYRWFLFGRLRRALAFGPAALLAGIAFIGHHVIVLNAYVAPAYFWTMTLPLCLCVGVGGVIWSRIYERSGSIGGPWISHIVVDLALMGIGYDLVLRT